MHLFNIIIYYFIISIPLIITTTNIFAQLQEISIFSKALCILETCKVRYVEPSVESSCCNVSPPGLTSWRSMNRQEYRREKKNPGNYYQT